MEYWKAKSRWEILNMEILLELKVASESESPEPSIIKIDKQFQRF